MQPAFIKKFKNFETGNHIAENIIPNNLKENSENMLMLVNKFFEFLNTTNAPKNIISNILENNDIDTVSDFFIEYLENEIAKDIPKKSKGDKKTIYKNLISFYQTKGSLDAIYSFFRLFYNETVEIFFPKDILFTVAGENTTQTIGDSYLAGGKYYQDFSYVVRSQINVNDWKSVLEKTCHPAGYCVFGELLVSIRTYNHNTGSFQDETGQFKGNLPNYITGLLEKDLLVLITIRVPKTRNNVKFFREILNILPVKNTSPEIITSINKSRSIWIDETPIFSYNDYCIKNFYTELKKPLIGINFSTKIKNFSLESLSGTIKGKIKYSFHEKNKYILGGKVLYIPDELYTNIILSQADVNKRPLYTENSIILSTNDNVDIGLITSSNITFKEVFIVADFNSGIENTFPDFCTLLSGTGGNVGQKRIMGNNATNSVATTFSLNDSGLIRKNGGSDTTTILPMTKSIIHTAVGSFATPLSYTDIMTVGYNTNVTNRSWKGNFYQIIFTDSLSDSERTSIVNLLKSNHSIA